MIHMLRPICFSACFGCFTCSRVVTGKTVDITGHLSHVPDLFRLLPVSPCNNNLIPSTSQTVAITGFTNWIGDQHCMYRSIFQVEPHFVGASGVCVCTAHTKLTKCKCWLICNLFQCQLIRFANLSANGWQLAMSVHNSQHNMTLGS